MLINCCPCNLNTAAFSAGHSDFLNTWYSLSASVVPVESDNVGIHHFQLFQLKDHLQTQNWKAAIRLYQNDASRCWMRCFEISEEGPGELTRVTQKTQACKDPRFRFIQHLHRTCHAPLQTCSPIKRQARLRVYYWACGQVIKALCCPSDCRRWSIPGFQKDGRQDGLVSREVLRITDFSPWDTITRDDAQQQGKNIHNADNYF